jgi:hypothetical protein
VTHGEYRVHLAEALEKAGVKGSLVPGDQMSAIAMHLPTEVLRAVLAKNIIYDEHGQYNQTGAVPFHQGWIHCCDDELTDRILTESLDEGKES